MEELHHLTDEELVRKTLQNREAFAYIIERYREKLLRYMRRITNVREDDLHDILQDTFIKAYINLNSFDTDLSFSSWIYRIAHNEVISTYRKLSVRAHGHQIDFSDDILATLSSDDDTSHKAYTEEYRRAVSASFELLPPVYREILVLKFFEEKSYEEISDILKKPPGTVGTHISRAKEKLRIILEKQGFKQEHYEQR